MISEILLISLIIFNFKIILPQNFLNRLKTTPTGPYKGLLGIYLKKFYVLCSILKVYGNGQNHHSRRSPA